jgi:uncharacterized protein
MTESVAPGGETDLGRMLRSLTVSRRSGRFTMVTRAHDEPPVGLGDGVMAVIAEAEGATVVVTIDAADRNGWTWDFEAAWLTLDVHSSLEAVGMTAAVSAALTREGIACNVIAAFHHDHLLVPMGRAGDAVECLLALRNGDEGDLPLSASTV